MVSYTESEVRELQQSALEHLWIYMREPSDMAEKGEPRIFVEGHGCQVTDVDGNTFIDAMSGLWLKNVGYGRKEIADAAYEQMLQLTYAPSGTTTFAAIKLAEKLAEITPGDLSRCFFTSGGSESVETALKLSRAYHKRIGEPNRYRFISRKGSYHGATFGALTLGGTPAFPRTDYEPVLPGVVHVAQPNPYHCEYGGATPSECAERCAAAVEDTIKFYGPDTVAAVIAEPVSSPLGSVVPGPEYWPMLRDICTRYGVLLIADEVITGFGRTGKMFACEHWGVTPDIMTVAKGITSGYIPMGGTILRKEVADAFVGSERAAFRHIITFGGHPVAAAASLKNIEIIEQEGLVKNSAKMGEHLLEGLREIKEKHPIVGDARGLGLMCALEIVKDRETKEHFPSEAKLRERLTEKFRDNGLLLNGGDYISIMPPLCVSRDEIERILSGVDRGIGEVEKELT